MVVSAVSRCLWVPLICCFCFDDLTFFWLLIKGGGVEWLMIFLWIGKAHDDVCNAEFNCCGGLFLFDVG